METIRQCYYGAHNSLLATIIDYGSLDNTYLIVRINSLLIGKLEMSFPTLDDENLEGIDCLVLVLEELSRRVDDSGESSDFLASNDVQLTGWILNHSSQHENRSVCRRSGPSKDSKEQRSSTPRRAISRQVPRNREDLVEFKHYLNPGKYIEEYRNEKAIRQEAAYRELLGKNDKRRVSDSFAELGKNCDHTENVPPRHAPRVVSVKEVQTAEDNNADKPFIVVSSKGHTRPTNLPLARQFQGRKLQWRPSVSSRKITQPKSQWSQAHIDVTLDITSQGNGDVSHMLPSDKKSEVYNSLQERRPSSNLIVSRRADLTSSPSSLRVENKTLPSAPQQISAQYSPMEKCDAWVKNRDNELGTISSKNKEQHGTKARTFRGYNTPHLSSSQLALRGNSLASPPKDTCNTRMPEGHSNLGCSAGSSAMDYSKYTDMFKNVLEFYGTRRLRPKSHSAVEQLLSMKT